MSDNISLDQVRSDDKFNFVSQYDSYNQFDVDDVESPLRSCNITNEYYEHRRIQVLRLGGVHFFRN